MLSACRPFDVAPAWIAMDVIHDTPFTASLTPILDADGSEARVAVFKTTYSIVNGHAVPADEQEPIFTTDQYLGEPQHSSTVAESDNAYFKPLTDLVVSGYAHAPYGLRASWFTASLSVGVVTKSVKVFGDRHWSYDSLTGISMSDPTPTAEVPICWERAFGGTDVKAAESSKPTWDPRNPIGTGFCNQKSTEQLDGLRLPNFEDPQQLIRTWSDKPAPQGLGFVGRSWAPRVRFAGTYDDAWQKTRMPLLPLDFDYRYFNAAPSDLTYPGFLVGGEPVIAENLAPCGRQAFALPSLHVTFLGTAKKKRFQLDGHLDTVHFQLDRNRVVLVFRAKYAVSQNEPADMIKAIVRYS